MSQFRDWLAQLGRDSQGPFTMPAITRGLAHSVVLELSGDFSGYTFTMQLRSAPDASGNPLGIMTCDPGDFENGITPLTISLPAAAQSGLPADDEADGVVTVVYDLIANPPEGQPYRMLGGKQPISGGVTQ